MIRDEDVDLCVCVRVHVRMCACVCVQILYIPSCIIIAATSAVLDGSHDISTRQQST